MTVLAFKRGILAADSGVVAGDVMVSTTRKIARSKSGYIGGGAGAFSALTRFLQWLEALDGDIDDAPAFNPDVENENDFSAIIVAPNGAVFTMDDTGTISEVEAPFYAEGSGAEFALGAMAAGASAERAVKLTCGWHIKCRGPVVIEKAVA